MIDPRNFDRNVYDPNSGKSSFQCHIEWLRRLLVTMQEKGVDDRYGDRVYHDLGNEIKWLTDMISIANSEREFVESSRNVETDDYNERELKVLSLVNDIAKCLAYPNDSCYPNIKTLTREFEDIFKTDEKPKTVVVSKVTEEDDW